MARHERLIDDRRGTGPMVETRSSPPLLVALTAPEALSPGRERRFVSLGCPKSDLTVSEANSSTGRLDDRHEDGW
jgi:hypothetical protein